ncbi:P-hydroxylaminobenzoate lyase [Enhygromyxa salina]|uniref:p-hydroxylaminobenzoate lyase n=1 Tax=Enhygromyxa salina TaxID=215803 RepID=A0A0C1ZM16_9BACT|nr:P-hydroxylaminobenzoate lyase [Enhygromyxa salina]
MTEQLLAALEPILARVAALDLAAATTAEQIQVIEATLEREFPHAGAKVQAIGDLIRRGIDAGVLANRGQPEARFSRVAKASAATHGLSIDIVSMIGAGLEHTHPAGEVTIGFPAAGIAADPATDCQFESRRPSWVFLGPGSRHVPRVEGGRMNLIYFLPNGAVEWHAGA